MKRIFTEKVIVNTAIGIVLISFLIMIPGCNYYRPITKVNKYPDTFFSEMMDKLYPESTYPRQNYPKENLEKLLFQEHQFYVIDTTGTWVLNNPSMKGDTMYAQVAEYFLPPNDNPDDYHYFSSKKYDPEADKSIVHGIKLYVDSLQFFNGDTAFVPFADVRQYDIYKKDNRREAGLTLAILGGVALATLVILIGVAIANYEPSSTTSCPFIFTYDGLDWHLEGEIFSGAILKTLERNDYLALSSDNAMPGGDFRIRLANQLEEIQYVNQADLMVVKHEGDVRVMVDKYGKAHTVREIVKPAVARDTRGNDILGALIQTDPATYDFDGEPDPLDHCMNYADLTFRCPSDPDSCKLIVKGHNTAWVDHLAKRLFDKMGNKYPLWNRYMDRKPAGTQQEWVLSQGLPLQVYLKTGQGWQVVDYFDIVGPLAAREMILPLDVRDAWSVGTAAGQNYYMLEIRLATGYNFWELDYAGMDFSEDAVTAVLHISPDQAFDQDHQDVAGLIQQDDHLYLVQGETGDEAILDFTLPGETASTSSLFLHSKGYYHQVVNKHGGSDLAFILTFLHPGRLSEWSYENHRMLRELLTSKE